MQPNLGMNSSSPPPSLKCHTSPSLFFMLHFSPQFSPTIPLFPSQPSIRCTFISLPIFLSAPPSPPPTAYVSQNLPIIPQWSELISWSWIIPDLYRGTVSFSLSPPPSLSLSSHSFSQQRKSWKPLECKVNVFNRSHPKAKNTSMAEETVCVCSVWAARNYNFVMLSTFPPLI